ncbi:uncharacterized protein PHALS_10765 [Plasmopara halstedii]|uniref:RxLR-like protein n=1 Tax=Plasmopara halstedii TaxID=4781 RepID=A0A0P1AHU4_PLAHL|nr:uncharacterized protein PHALS_10765 [Plasmopara halstedii]CEG40576.1 hypothetical protein PHALS_10765 [Plasmopara halstedii]|eukprot:XP_024576945.1 hypothetical protein PHALS_10765 [Plasmopara halstedii]
MLDCRLKYALVLILLLQCARLTLEQLLLKQQKVAMGFNFSSIPSYYCCRLPGNMSMRAASANGFLTAISCKQLRATVQTSLDKNRGVSSFQASPSLLE